jgi:hypothetical protein
MGPESTWWRRWRIGRGTSPRPGQDATRQSSRSEVQLIIEGVDLGRLVDELIAIIKAEGGDPVACARLALDDLARQRAEPLTDAMRRVVLNVAVTHATRPEPQEQFTPSIAMPEPRGGRHAVPRSAWNWDAVPLPDRYGQSVPRGQRSSSSNPKAWRQLEELVATVMGRGAATRSGSHDGGIDVESSTTVAQVKRQSSIVGAPAIRQLFGAAQHIGKRGEFYTTSGYSKDAINFARETGVALYIVDENTGRRARVE